MLAWFLDYGRSDVLDTEITTTTRRYYIINTSKWARKYQCCIYYGLKNGINAVDGGSSRVGVSVAN